MTKMIKPKSTFLELAATPMRNLIVAPPSAENLPLVKRFTPTEAEECPHKQFSYNCDERWVAGHQCKQKSQYLIKGDDMDEGMGRHVFH
jgi:hypothetical protein